MNLPTAGSSLKPTIIGCGNRERGDDAAGIMAAERIRAFGIDAATCTGESSELLEAWSGAADVIVIDCVVSGASAGTVHVWDGAHPIALGRSHGSTHGLGVGEAIQLSRALGCLPARLRIYGIEGHQFEIRGAVSPEVEKAINEVVNSIVRELKAKQ